MPLPQNPMYRAEPQHGVLAEALAGVKRALLGQPVEGQPEEKKQKKHWRGAAGEKWVDNTLDEWPENDHRLFVGDLGNEVNDDVLTKAFVKYTSFAKAKVVRDKRSNKTKGYGFVSFLDPLDFAKALREMDGKYIGNRPAKLRRSDWHKREGTKEVVMTKKGKFVGKKAKNHIGELKK